MAATQSLPAPFQCWLSKKRPLGWKQTMILQFFGTKNRCWGWNNQILKWLHSNSNCRPHFGLTVIHKYPEEGANSSRKCHTWKDCCYGWSELIGDNSRNLTGGISRWLPALCPSLVLNEFAGIPACSQEFRRFSQYFLGIRRKWHFCTKKRCLLHGVCREMSSSAATAEKRVETWRRPQD